MKDEEEEEEEEEEVFSPIEKLPLLPPSPLSSPWPRLPSPQTITDSQSLIHWFFLVKSLKMMRLWFPTRSS